MTRPGATAAFADDPSKHPHQPAGSPEGGQFAPAGGGGGSVPPGQRRKVDWNTAASGPDRIANQEGDRLYRRLRVALREVHAGDPANAAAVADRALADAKRRSTLRTARRYNSLRQLAIGKYGAAAVESPEWAHVRATFRAGLDDIHAHYEAMHANVGAAAVHGRVGESLRELGEDHGRIAGRAYEYIREIGAAYTAFKAKHAAAAFADAMPAGGGGWAAAFDVAFADYDSSKHPHRPTGSPDGGQFAPTGGTGASAASGAGSAKSPADRFRRHLRAARRYDREAADHAARGAALADRTAAELGGDHATARNALAHVADRLHAGDFASAQNWAKETYGDYVRAGYPLDHPAVQKLQGVLFAANQAVNSSKAATAARVAAAKVGGAFDRRKAARAAADVAAQLPDGGPYAPVHAALADVEDAGSRSTPGQFAKLARAAASVSGQLAGNAEHAEEVGLLRALAWLAIRAAKTPDVSKADGGTYG